MYLKTFNNLKLKNSIVPLISSQNNTDQEEDDIRTMMGKYYSGIEFQYLELPPVLYLGGEHIYCLSMS